MRAILLRQVQKQSGLIKKEPRQGAARTKTRSERTRIEGKQPRRAGAEIKTIRKRTWIDQKTTRMRYIQVEKEPGRSASNLEEVHQEPEKSRNNLDE